MIAYLTLGVLAFSCVAIGWCLHATTARRDTYRAFRRIERWRDEA